jgi:hypothetical protein
VNRPRAAAQIAEEEAGAQGEKKQGREESFHIGGSSLITVDKIGSRVMKELTAPKLKQSPCRTRLPGLGENFASIFL